MASSNHPSKGAFKNGWVGWLGKRSETIMASRGRLNTAPVQNRRVMLSSSGFASLTVTVNGSSVMPQIGQLPGTSRTI